MSRSKSKQDVNKKIRAIREFKGYSQEYVADKLGLTQSQYSRREVGSISFTSEEIGRVCEILDVNAGVIFSSDSLDEMIQKSLIAIHTNHNNTPSNPEVNTQTDNKYLVRLLELMELQLKEKEERIKELESLLDIRTSA